MNDRSTLLLEHHLKELKLPSFLREYGKMAAQCAAEGVDHPQYLLRLAELELIDRHQRMVGRRIRAARFPAVKSLDTFDFTGHPLGEQVPGDGTGPVRIHPAPGEYHRSQLLGDSDGGGEAGVSREVGKSSHPGKRVLNRGF